MAAVDLAFLIPGRIPEVVLPQPRYDVIKKQLCLNQGSLCMLYLIGGSQGRILGFYIVYTYRDHRIAC